MEALEQLIAQIQTLLSTSFMDGQNPQPGLVHPLHCSLRQHTFIMAA